MPTEDAKKLKFNEYQKFDQGSFIIYEGLECLIERINGCKNNPENSITKKVGKHITLGFSISTI